MADTAELRKARGAFFTPVELCDFVAEWAVRSPVDRVFEPSCGEAAFLLSIADRLRGLGGVPQPDQLHGIEIHEASSRQAAALLAQSAVAATLHVGDFFAAPHPAEFDAVVGNPPYVRYQNFAGEARAKAQQAALAQGVRLSSLASSWAAFVVHASTFLRPGGRLGLVLPAELLSVNYAAPVRRFLLQRFARVKLVLFEARVFPGVLEEVVLLLAEGEGPTDHYELYQARDLTALSDLKPRVCSPRHAEEKWVHGLLAPEAAAVYGTLTGQAAFTELLTWGETDLGMVTGNNRYFTLSLARAKELGLPPADLLPISPPSSRHLRGLTFTEKAWQEMRRAGSAVYLFYPDAKKPSKAALEYIATGERTKVDAAYKCRVRSPWWRVPQVGVPDLFVTYMNHDAPRLVANRAGVPYLNSIHGLTLHPAVKQLGLDLLPMAMLNSLTLLGGELVGRSYGGGILKLEPKEADKLPVPSAATIEEAAPELRTLRPQLARHLRRGELEAVVKHVDRVLLTGALRLKRADVLTLREARAALFARRVARGGKGEA